MELWLARHGTTEANLEGRYQGRLDFPLSGRGCLEAARLADRLKDAPLDHILCSDLQRARQTAQIIADVKQMALIKLPLLRECAWGAVEGLTREEIKSRYPMLAASLAGRAGRALLIPGAEGKRRLKARCGALLRMIGKRFGTSGRLLLVSHGRFLNALISTSLGLTSRQHWPYAQNPASLSILKYFRASGSFRLDLFNDYRHLEEALPGQPDQVN